MEYLNKVLGIKVTYEDVEFKHLPNFIVMRYRLQMASMNGKKAIFLYPKTELEQIGVLKKHVARIQKNENLPVVLVLKEIISRQKEYLIREKIPFVVEGRFICLLWRCICRSGAMPKGSNEKKCVHRRRCYCCILYVEAHKNCLQVRLRKTWN